MRSLGTSRFFNQRENALIFYQILLTNLEKCWEISPENLYVDIGVLKRVNLLSLTLLPADLHDRYLTIIIPQA